MERCQHPKYEETMIIQPLCLLQGRGQKNISGRGYFGREFPLILAIFYALLGYNNRNGFNVLGCLNPKTTPYLSAISFPVTFSSHLSLCHSFPSLASLDPSTD